MRRYDVSEINENHYRALRLLLKLNQAEAHIVVRSKRPWPPQVSFSPRQTAVQIAGESIN